jgi:hypothetical protein
VIGEKDDFDWFNETCCPLAPVCGPGHGKGGETLIDGVAVNGSAKVVGAVVLQFQTGHLYACAGHDPGIVRFMTWFVFMHPWRGASSVKH